MSKEPRPEVSGFRRARIVAMGLLVLCLVVLITLVVGQSREDARNVDEVSVITRIADRTPPADLVERMDVPEEVVEEWQPDLSSVVEPAPIPLPMGPVYSERQRAAFAQPVSSSDVGGGNRVGGRGQRDRSLGLNGQLGQRGRSRRAALPGGGEVPPELASMFEEIGRESERLSALLDGSILPGGLSGSEQSGASGTSAAVDGGREFRFQHRRSVSRFVLDEGTLIPGVLSVEINSDLPGAVTAVVSEHVYDSRNFRYLLIPRGSKLIGEYDSDIRYGQNRLGIAWHRIIFPNGDSLRFSDLPGVDGRGRSGMRDRVNHHTARIFGSALLMSVISAGFQAADGGSQDIRLSPTELAIEGASEELERAAGELLRRNLSIAPTIRIRAGQRVSVFLRGDIEFVAPYEAKPQL